MRQDGSGEEKLELHSPSQIGQPDLFNPAFSHPIAKLTAKEKTVTLPVLFHSLFGSHHFSLSFSFCVGALPVPSPVSAASLHRRACTLSAQRDATSEMRTTRVMSVESETIARRDLASASRAKRA